MDSDNPKSARDRKRFNLQPQVPGYKFQRARLEQPQQPGLPGIDISRVSNRPQQRAVAGIDIPQISYRPYQPGVSVPRLHTPQVSRSRNVGSQQSHSSQVEPLSRRGQDNLSTGNVPTGGHGNGDFQILGNDDKLNKSNSRPESSISGKQGFSGKEVNLVANYFPITSYTNWSLNQYKVDFSPQEERIKVKRGLLRVHRKILGGYLFDGTSMFSGIKYDSDKFELTSKRGSDEQMMIITITFTSVIQANDHVNIQVFNILMRNCLRHLGLSLIQRNYYDEKAKIDIERHKLQLWPGYKTTINMFDNGLLLHAEISTKIMRNETVLDFFHECRKLSHSNPDWMNSFISGVLGSIVLTKYNNRTYLINDINNESTPQSTFMLKDGTQKTYIDYYQEKWGITIRDCNQPMLVSKQKKTLKNNDVEILIYLVPELCFLTGFSETMRDNRILMKDLSVYTRVGPTERIKRYNNFMNRIQSTEKAVEEIKEWNLTLSNELVKIKGRVLPSEKVYCNTTFYDSGTDADWTKHVRSLPMYASAKIQCWIIVYPKQNTNDVKQFVSTMRRVGDGMSFKLPQPEFYGIQDGRIGTYLIALEQIINQMNPSFILCVIPFKRGDVYSLIKRKLCVDRAVPSQIVLLKNVQNKYNMSVCTKIAIQINCKVGGAPWMIDIPVKGMLIMGFDVCHDKQKNISYGAIVASINDTHTSFYSHTQPHQSGEEISSYFVSSMTLVLHSYKKLNKNIPTRIVIYRDGVGDGQISHVHKIEITRIKDACAAFYQEKEIPLAFIIVKKRISTKLFDTQRGFSNPEPGTIVDTIITNPTMYDFFLVSQNVKIGTVTPTHYNVIVDTLPNWSPNYMQLLTFKLTHMYYNWSGTIRVPAHCLLAHKLASLAGQILKTSPNVALSELLYYL